MKGHLRSKYQHSTLLEMSYFIMTIIIHWLLFSHFIILCNEFKMFITLGFYHVYDSKYGLYINDWRNAKYTMHNYFTACIYIVKVNIKWPRLPFQLGTRGWSTVWCLLKRNNHKTTQTVLKYDFLSDCSFIFPRSRFLL